MEVPSTSVSFPLLLFLTTLFPSMVTTSTTSIIKPKPLVLNLIHSNLVLSRNDLPLLKPKGYNDDFLFDLSPVNGGLMFVNFTIGQPPLQQLAVLDTGSARLWLLCYPCQGCKEITGLVFNPSRSTTYAELPCNDTRCKTALPHGCMPPAPCPFRQGYAIGPEASGVFATEQLILGTSDEGTRIISDVMSGCANESEYSIVNDTRFNGVFGLGYHSESLVKKLGSKFSYCVGDITDPNCPYSQLRFGGGIEFEGDSIPMDVGGVYRVSLESISIGSERLAISQHTKHFA